MPTLTLESEPLAIDVFCSDDAFSVSLDDGREISVPLTWFPRLLHGTPEQRRHWDLIGPGQGIRWPDLDGDISVAGILAGKGDQTKGRRTTA